MHGQAIQLYSDTVCQSPEQRQDFLTGALMQTCDCSQPPRQATVPSCRSALAGFASGRTWTASEGQPDSMTPAARVHHRRLWSRPEHPPIVQQEEPRGTLRWRPHTSRRQRSAVRRARGTPASPPRYGSRCRSPCPRQGLRLPFLPSDGRKGQHSCSRPRPSCFRDAILAVTKHHALMAALVMGYCSSQPEHTM